MSDVGPRPAAVAETAPVDDRRRVRRRFDERWLEYLADRPEPLTASSMDGGRKLVVDGDGLDEWLVADHAVPAADAR